MEQGINGLDFCLFIDLVHTCNVFGELFVASMPHLLEKLQSDISCDEGSMSNLALIDASQ